MGNHSHNRSKCKSGKRRWRDQKSAQRALRSIVPRSDRARVPVRAYECPLCKGWHITSQEQER